MEYSRENVMSPEELAKEFGISLSRLADLRSQGKGPPYFKFGVSGIRRTVSTLGYINK